MLLPVLFEKSERIADTKVLEVKQAVWLVFPHQVDEPEK